MTIPISDKIFFTSSSPFILISFSLNKEYNLSVDDIKSGIEKLKSLGEESPYYKNIINTEIPKYVLEDLDNEINKNNDIILIDRSLFDRMIWMDRLYNKNGVTKEEYDNYIDEYIPIIKNKIDIIIGLYTDSLTSLRRDYTANTSLEKRTFLNEDNINEYNDSLMNIKELSNKENINFYLFDTTNKSERDISFEILDTILTDMRSKYISILNETFNK